MSLAVENLSFSYSKDSQLLSGVSFRIESGMTCCLLGPNGAGKTTLIRCIIGLSKPSSGSVRIDEYDIRDLSAPLLARKVAYVPQSVETAFPLTALDMVLTGRTTYVRFGGTPTDADREVAFEALEQVGVNHLAYRPFNELSGGERQLVTIARALAQHTPVVVLDEPTSALDFGNQVRVLGIIHELANSDKAILMTSHAPNQALDGADMAILLKNGEVIASGSPAVVIDGPMLSDLYDVPVSVLSLDAHGARRVCVPDLTQRSFSNLDGYLGREVL